MWADDEPGESLEVPTVVALPGDDDEEPPWTRWRYRLPWIQIVVAGLAVACVVLVAATAALGRLPLAAAVAAAGFVAAVSWSAPLIMRLAAVGALLLSVIAGVVSVLRPDEYNWLAYAAAMGLLVLAPFVARVGAVIPRALFLVWWVLNTAVFIALHASGYAEWVAALVTPVAALVAYLLGAGTSDGRRITVMLLIFAAVESVLALAQSLGGWPVFVSQKLTQSERNPLGYVLPGVSRSVTPGLGTFSHFNNLGALLALCVPLALGFWLERRRSAGRVALLMVLALGLWVTYSRASWLGASAAVLVLAFVRGTRERRLDVGAVVLSLVALLLATPVAVAYYAQSANVAARLLTWKAALAAASAHPEKLIFGFGYLFFSREALRNPSVLSERMASLHSWLLQLFLELGLVGFILFLFLVLPPLASGLRRSRSLFEQAIASGLLAFLVSQLLDNSVFSRVGVFAFLMLGVLTGVQEHGRRAASGGLGPPRAPLPEEVGRE